MVRNEKGDEYVATVSFPHDALHLNAAKPGAPAVLLAAEYTREPSLLAGSANPRWVRMTASPTGAGSHALARPALRGRAPARARLPGEFARFYQQRAVLLRAQASLRLVALQPTARGEKLKEWRKFLAGRKKAAVVRLGGGARLVLLPHAPAGMVIAPLAPGPTARAAARTQRPSRFCA